MPDQAILKLSVSKAKTYADCNAKYNFSYNLKLPQKEWKFFSYGKCVHQILEDFHLAYISGSKEPYNIVMGIAYKKAMSDFGDKLSAEDKKEIYEMIDLYLQKITKQKSTISNILAVEKNFNFPITDRISINGMIDRVQKDSDGFIHVIDYKTSKSAKYLKKDFFQLQTYAYALHMEDPTITKIRGSYMMLRLGHQFITKDFSMDEVLETKNKFENYAKSIEMDKLWRTNPTPLCGYCSFLEHCEDGKNQMNKGIKAGQVEW